MQTTLTKEYAGRGKAVFIEGGTFKTIIPLPEGKVIAVNDTINDTVNDIVKKRLGRIILLSYNNQGLRISELANKLKVSEVTIKRDMQKIRTLVAYRGSQKTGGYFLTDYMLSKLDM
ncbi:MAG: HTH domain-containing protein [Chitinophagaceae bacterium]|jgi:transcriptional antiterminator|nr:HTH domain-containing protein [Chitinophagaceae bacterium]